MSYVLKLENAIFKCFFDYNVYPGINNFLAKILSLIGACILYCNQGRKYHAKIGERIFSST